MRPLTWDEWPEPARKVFQAMRSPAGDEMVLQKNVFVERILPASVLRGLTEAEMTVYRNPYREPGESRRPTLTWPRQIPIDGEPADVVAIVDEYARWLTKSPVPKLFVNAEPGVILTGAQRDFCRTWPNQDEVTVRGSHFVQEDSPREIGEALATFLSRLPLVTAPAGALAPYRVLDLTGALGPLAGKMLADLGADVVRVEPPEGSALRRLPPFADGVAEPERGLAWWAYAAGTRSVTLDLETADGRAGLLSLVRAADFLLESLPPGTLDRLGLGWPALHRENRRLILTSISPFGRSGPSSRLARARAGDAGDGRHGVRGGRSRPAARARGRERRPPARPRDRPCSARSSPTSSASRRARGAGWTPPPSTRSPPPC